MMGALDSILIPCLAALDNGEIRTSYAGLEPGYVGWQVFLLIFFILLNGFFVAAEFALVKVRSSQLDPHVEAGKGTAKLTHHIIDHLDAYLSACQLGITIASIVLGSVSEPFISMLLQPLLSDTGISDWWITKISFVIGITAITFLHVVIGEQVPKVLAIRKALGTSMICSRPLHWFYLLFKLPIRILNACSSLILRKVFRVEPVEEHDIIHSSEELRILVEQTGGAGEVTETERDILIKALELNDLTVRDIMTPRNEVIMLNVEKSFEENLEIAVESKHTRFPLVRDHLDNSVGLIHIKDLLAETRSEDPDILRIRRDIAPVPEMLPLDTLLQTFLAEHAHMALVVDEFGGALGLVMLDDVIEELVGKIQDEFDEEDRQFRRVDDGEFVVSGTLSLHELAVHVPELILESPDVSTVGGYITHVIGHLPQNGESIVIGEFEITVLEANERFVREARFRRVNLSLDEEEESSSKKE